MRARRAFSQARKAHDERRTTNPIGARRRLAVSTFTCLAIALSVVARAEPTQVYFGDTHLHTSFSPDAFLTGNQSAGPETAYRYAKGLPVVHPGHGARIQIETPLDFLAVSDHAEFLGVLPMIFEGDPRVRDVPNAVELRRLVESGEPGAAFDHFLNQVMQPEPDPALGSKPIARSAWEAIIDAAERNYEPGRFTTLLAWEWSAMPDRANLHRIVLSRDGAAIGKRFLPFSRLDGDTPESLWAWLEATSRRTGARFIAMPHNSNISKGLMFAERDSRGRPIDAAYAKTRARWEPVVEVTQFKGDSETHPNLSPTDEFADYEPWGETFGYRVGPGDMVRDALRRGLEIESRTGENPYRFGLIGSTDAHTAIPSAEEDNFHGKFATQGTPAADLAPITPTALNGMEIGAAGLAAVWAEENTREAIFDAFERREVYATTGTRITLRFFGGWEFHSKDLATPDPATAGYGRGVPMGRTLAARPSRGADAPRFLVIAAKDPAGANLDRIQIVKGWLDAEGKSAEKVYDVAWSDDRRPDAVGKVPAVGNTVDLETARYTNEIGDAQLAVVWTDPDFEASQSAFYYVRVLEIPTPRHTLYDAVALGRPHPPERPATIQERAYSSPIWYRPEAL